MQIISSTGKHNMDAHSEHKAQKETDSAHLGFITTISISCRPASGQILPVS